MSTHPPARTRPIQDVPPRGPELFSLGSAVREARARLRLSQEGLAFHAGMHRNYVGAIERGEINPTFRVMLKLTKGLDLPLSELLLLYERHYLAYVPERRRPFGGH